MQKYKKQGLSVFVAILALMAGLVLGTRPVAAQEATLFPATGDTYSVASNPHWWHAGDYVQGTRTLALSSIGRVDYGMVVTRNGLNGLGRVDLTLYINGTAVGSFSVLPGQMAKSESFTFPAISGPVYTIRLQETNLVCSGCGSIEIGADLSTMTFHGAAVDNDGDGFSPPEDCNDNDPNINPGATEIVDDGVDQNCDGGELCYVDADDDTYRPDAFSTLFSVDFDCLDSGEARASDPTGDCNDGNPAINPGAADIPGNGIDEDCNGVDAALCYVDADMDGFGTSLGITVVAPDGTCDTAQGESTTADDCNDGDAAIHPGAEEVCDGVDNNCDGQIDEACTSVDHINGQFVRTRQGIQLKAFVFVADSGGPVVGVEVEATLDVPGVGTGIVKMATTNADGRATFKVTSTKPRGDWNLCVTDINTPGYTFIAGPGDCNTWAY